MTALPIVERELRLVARRNSTYWRRVGFGAGMAGLAAYFLLISFRFIRGLPGYPAGSIFLGMLADLVFVYACISGVNGTADSISQEKREGTLGLLFLTDLKG